MDISALNGVSTDFWGNTTKADSTQNTSGNSFDQILGAAMKGEQRTSKMMICTEILEREST